MKKAVIIGLGLIGGSIALELKKRLNYRIEGIDNTPANVQKALELGIIEAPTDYEHLTDAALVLVAVPVNYISQVLTLVLDKIGDDTLVMDVGSVKATICQAVAAHPRRKQFVAAHPMAGTEHSGPEAALYDLFDGKVMALCEVEKTTDWQLLDRALTLSKALNMRVKMMSPTDHDLHTAYVSHLSHVSSFMLGKTVLEIEKDEAQIFDLASTGFASTVRLAKSDAQMWTPIFTKNKANVLKALSEYIKNLQQFYHLLETDQTAAITEVIHQANYIRKILK
ncbi:prephenate dehydrogenase [Capnocytophaga leadbetteri]|uniref:prephenate dehydrogenase n=1 Tax=Capnocytophaga leadbetteri TaxID=327575 RepID=UPI0028D4284B|nr:prephenate dehydrogenase [Capnocytophaga leadbetteri]